MLHGEARWLRRKRDDLTASNDGRVSSTATPVNVPVPGAPYLLASTFKY